MGLVRTVAPTNPPVDLMAEVKEHLRISPDDGSHDARLRRLALAAAELTERVTGRAWITQTWRASYGSFPVCSSYADGRIYLPRPPLVTVDAIQYVDTAGTLQTLPAEDYRVSTDSHPGIVTPAWGKTWPVTRLVTDAVTIEYTAGYGPSPSDVPEEVRQAVLLTIGAWFDQTASVVTGTIAQQLPGAAFALLAGLKVGRYPGMFGVAA